MPRRRRHQARRPCRPSLRENSGNEQQHDHRRVDDEARRSAARSTCRRRRATPSSSAATSEPLIDPGAADRDHEQEVHQVLERERRVEPEHVDAQRAAQAGQRRAQREGDAEEQLDVDARRRPPPAGCRPRRARCAPKRVRAIARPSAAVSTTTKPDQEQAIGAEIDARAR